MTYAGAQSECTPVHLLLVSSDIKITTRPVSVEVQPLTVTILQQREASNLSRLLPGCCLVYITCLTVNESVDALGTTTVLHDDLQVTLTLLHVELDRSTVLHDLIDLGLMIVHVDVIGDATLVSTDLILFEVHVESITQHDCVVLNLLGGQCGVVHGGVPLCMFIL